ncbi:MAG: hypothetical protein DCC58_05945 [Chloroflexi bacterium]|nr:MAG: hypothetical protein DCC58_05945 [Chloroflexota bacterium]
MSVSSSAEERYRAAAGAVLRRLRTERGWSLRDMAEHAGAAHTTIYAIERAEAVPGIDILERVALACDLDLPAILRLIVDELGQPAAGPSPTLSDALTALAELTPSQRSEALSFIAYLRYRDRERDAQP